MTGHVQRLGMTLAGCIAVAIGEDAGFSLGWCSGVIFAVVVLGGPDLINRYCAEVERWWKS